MSKYTDNPHDFTNVESLHQLRSHKRQIRGYGNVLELDEYVDMEDVQFERAVGMTKDEYIEWVKETFADDPLFDF